jgi:ligand-binding sensor domain-containing protein/serine phosphatase RsbU (regulator of sigma subunit)
MSQSLRFLAGFVFVGCAVVGLSVGCQGDRAREDGRLVLRGGPAREAAGEASTLPPRFERFNVADGLSSGHVRAILQDRQGFLWVATYDGLNRYDGATFTAFHHDPEDPRSLGDNITHALFEDRDGHLWLGTERGAERFDPATETFTHYRHDAADPKSLSPSSPGGVRAFAEDASGTLWVGTWGGGLSRFDPATGTFTRFMHDAADPASLAHDNVFALQADPDGALWVGTAGGLDRLDPATGAFTHVPYRPSGGAPTRPVVFSLYRDRGGVLWIGTYEEGLYRLDPPAGSGQPPAASATRNYPAGPDGLGHPWVLTIFEDDDGTLWAGTDGGGLHRYDPARDAFTRFVHEPADPTSLSDDRVIALGQDRSGVLWVGTSRGLSRRLPLSEVVAHERHRPGDPTSLSADDVTAFVEDHEGTLWVGTDGGGLNRRDPMTGAFERIRLDPSAPLSGNTDAIVSLGVDSAGTVWVGTYDGLFRRDPRTSRFEPFTVPDSTGVMERFETAMAIEAGPHGRLWVATQHGLFDVDPGAGRAIRYVPDPADPASLSDGVVHPLLTDPGGRLWVGFSNGALDRFDSATGTFAHLRADVPGAGYVTTLLRTRDGDLWVGTSDGLERFTEGPSGHTVTRYGRDDGLPNTVVNGLLEDDHGRLWVATNRGLVRFNPQAETVPDGGLLFQGYGARDGLQSDLWNERAAYRSPSTGTFYVGGDNGYNAFDPDYLPEAPPPGPVVLTGLRLMGEPVRVGAEGSPLQTPLSRAAAVRLGPKDAVVTFAFAALDYAAPAQHRYAVRLGGLHDDWLDVGARREVTFTRLPPGHYTLRVRAAGRDGVWGEPSAPLAVTVAPPWWRTGWAYLAYGLLLLGAVFAVDRAQRRRLTARVRAQGEAERVRLRVEAAEAQARVLEAENERKTKELEAARALQLQLLPRKVPSLPNLQVAAYMQTATEVGGDYYDFHCADDGALTVAIGDATGHGLRAGLMVAIAKSLFQSTMGEPDLPQLLGRFNRQLKRMNLWNLFMAMALVRIHEGRLLASSAGMPPILVYRARTGEVSEVVLKGVPLGAFPAFEYGRAEVALDPGDTVVLMSDGLLESFNGAGEMLGWERVKAAFAGVGSHSPEEVIACLSRAGAAWRGGKRAGDDVTLVVVQQVAEPSHTTEPTGEVTKASQPWRRERVGAAAEA